MQLSGTEAGAIYVFDEQQGEFHLRATYGMDQELIAALKQQHIGMDEPNVELALAEGEPIQVPDLREDTPLLPTRSSCALAIALGWWRRSFVEKMSSACWWSAAARQGPSHRTPSI